MVDLLETPALMSEKSFHIISERTTQSREDALQILEESKSRDPKTIVSLTIYSNGVPLSMRGPVDMIQDFLRTSLSLKE